MLRLTLLLLLGVPFLLATEVCPTGPFGAKLTCAFKCCESTNGPNVVS